MASDLPVLLVKTKHSEYRIDQDAGTFQRHPVHESASDLSHYGNGPEDVNSYLDIMSPLEVGSRLVITTPDGGWVRSTEIVGVEHE